MAGSPGAISTGSLRMTGNARHGFGGWADSLQGWTMKRAWTRRWTALRLIWSSISTLPDCSDLRNDQCSQAEKADQNAVRDAGELQRPTDIGGVKFGAAAFAHETGFDRLRSEEHTSELQSLMRISYAVFCLKKIKNARTYD